MKKDIKKQTNQKKHNLKPATNSSSLVIAKNAMVKLSIVNQVFGYLATVVLGIVIVVFFSILLSNDPTGIVFAILLFGIYAGIPVVLLSLVWIIISLVQSAKLKKVGIIDKITPKKGTAILVVFASIALLVIVLIAIFIVMSQFSNSNADEDLLSQFIFAGVLILLPLCSTGQAVFNSIYTSKLKKSL